MPGLPSEHVIRQAQYADAPMLTLTLAAAFENDPVANFCIRTDARRKWALRAGFKRALDLYQPYGLTFIAEDGAGTAVWTRHDQWQLTFWQECWLIPLYIRVCGINRFMRLSRGFDAMKSIIRPSGIIIYICSGYIPITSRKAWAVLCCAPCSSVATASRCLHTLKHPAPVIFPSMSDMGSG